MEVARYILPALLLDLVDGGVDLLAGLQFGFGEELHPGSNLAP